MLHTGELGHLGIIYFETSNMNSYYIYNIHSITMFTYTQRTVGFYV